MFLPILFSSKYMLKSRYPKSRQFLISVYTGKYEIPGVEGPVFEGNWGKEVIVFDEFWLFYNHNV